MVLLKKTAAGFALSLSVLFGFTDCRDMIHDIDAISGNVSALKSDSMIEIKDISNGGFTGLSPYEINAYETTYLLWYEVAQWAKDNGFRFIKPGVDGNTGKTDEPGLYAYFPVTSLHPADIFTWCNAYSIKRGLTPVYYKDPKLTQILKNSTDIANETYIKENTLIHDTSGNLLVAYDFSIPKTIYQKADANGYRLPTTKEWQYAARGAMRTKEDVSFEYAGSNDLKEVAAAEQLKIPGSFKANGIGTYDMSGNVCEYSVEPRFSNDNSYITITDGTIHCYGGHYYNGNKQILSVKTLYDLKGIITNYPTLFGFRLAKNIEQ